MPTTPFIEYATIEYALVFDKYYDSCSCADRRKNCSVFSIAAVPSSNMIFTPFAPTSRTMETLLVKCMKVILTKIRAEWIAGTLPFDKNWNYWEPSTTHLLCSEEEMRESVDTLTPQLCDFDKFLVNSYLTKQLRVPECILPEFEPLMEFLFSDAAEVGEGWVRCSCCLEWNREHADGDDDHHHSDNYGRFLEVAPGEDQVYLPLPRVGPIFYLCVDCYMKIIGKYGNHTLKVVEFFDLSEEADIPLPPPSPPSQEVVIVIESLD